MAQGKILNVAASVASMLVLSGSLGASEREPTREEVVRSSKSTPAVCLDRILIT